VSGRYLLDTNVLSRLVRAPPPQLKQRLREAGERNLCTSIVVACELRFGARKKGSAELSSRIDQLLGSFDVLPLEVGVDAVYADLRFALEALGQPIGANDLLIAAHALEQQAVLVTANVGEFVRVPGLQVEDWFA
jgi:tRNA(fMet)-specific endonuclease VapC